MSESFQGIEFRCPFCGGRASAGYVDGDARTGTPTCFHALPVCPTWVRLGPIAYLRAVNDAQEQKGRPS